MMILEDDLEEDLRVKLCGRYNTQVPFEQCREVPYPNPEGSPRSPKGPRRPKGP